MKKEYLNRRPVILLLLLVALMLGAIVYLKNNAQIPVSGTLPVDDTLGNMAVPDTTSPADVSPLVGDTVVSAPADTKGRDPRPADEAGEEDGYWTGLYDGTAGRERSEADVESNFPTQRERDSYAASYAEGYRRGYEEGSRHRKRGE
jgi:hypothetical protein